MACGSLLPPRCCVVEENRQGVVGMLAFEGVVERGSGGGAYIVVPDEVLADLGRGGRFRARGRLSDVEFRSSTMPIGGGRVCLGVHKATRKAAGVDFGDAVLVEIEPDDDLLCTLAE